MRSRIFERITDGIVVLDRDFRYSYIDERAAHILGRPRPELLGTRLGEVYLDTIGKTVKRQIEEALRQQRHHCLERHNSELGRWFKICAYPDEDGLVLCFFDVTEQKEETEKLAQLDRNSPLQFEESAEAIYVKDRSGVYRFVSDAAAEVFGIAADDVIGKSDRELFDGERAAANRAGDEQVIEHVESGTRKAVRSVDGEPRVYHEHKYPYTDESGAVSGIVGLFRDVNRQERQKQELNKLRREQKLILEHTEDSIVIVDVEEEEGEYSFYYERLQAFPDGPLSFDPEYVQGRTPRQVFGDELGSNIEENYRRCIETRGPVSYDQVVPYPGGRIIWNAKFAPIIVGGEVTRLVGVARNITERVTQEEKLRRKNERLDEFASVVSHDLRNPLNVAHGRTTLAQEELAESGVESDHLKKVDEALDRMESIIVDTLVLARRGDQVSATESIAVADLVEQCWEMVDTGELSLEIEDRFTIQGDRERLQHIFENLFRNTVEHGDADGTVWVGQAGRDSFYVEDDGPGIPKEKRESVFEAGQTSLEEGTGFGLTIVKRIAEAHNWQVRATEGRDGGARFEFEDVKIDE